MRKLVLQMQISVDGFVGGPNGEIDWIFKTLDDSATAWIVDALWQAGVHIMGSRTFNDMSAYWPSSTEPYAAPMNEIPKVVFSRKGFSEPIGEATTTRAFKDASHARMKGDAGSTTAISPNAAAWADSSVAGGDLTEEITRLKQQPGKDILAHGGARFAQSLAELSLVDEYRLITHPIALGHGLPLFSGLSKPLDFKLVSTTTFGTGAVVHVYRPA